MAHERRQLLHQKLHLHYGYKGFRSLQLDACEAILDVQDTLIILPTGGGLIDASGMSTLTA
jgi:superfamily II DNA helicase RecQ